MKPLETLGRVKTRDGADLVLYHRDGDYQIRLAGLELMTSRAHGSEEAMAELALQALGKRRAPKVLIGGLGMGFTLRATLDHFPRKARVTVAEVFPEVVTWNRGPLGPLAGHPLDDRRVRVREDDVTQVLERGPFDAILLDVDNGPRAFTLESNAGLYTARGLGRLAGALTEHGVLALWSAQREPAFERRLRQARLRNQRHHVRARGKAGGPRHTIYLARRWAAGPFPPFELATS